jgi:hypothetical protein
MFTSRRGIGRCADGRILSAGTPVSVKKFTWCALLVCFVGIVADARAEEYSQYLSCAGTFVSAGKPAREANADFALRYNNRTALIQGSNVLPVGEILRYVPTPAVYTMTYLLRPQGAKVIAVPGWFQSTILVHYPNLNRLNQIRLSINRQSGKLEGKMLNEEDELLGQFSMQCDSQNEQDIAPPKF